MDSSSPPRKRQPDNWDAQPRSKCKAAFTPGLIHEAALKACYDAYDGRIPVSAARNAFFGFAKRAAILEDATSAMQWLVACKSSTGKKYKCRRRRHVAGAAAEGCVLRFHASEAEAILKDGRNRSAGQRGATELCRMMAVEER
ncbi:DUF982 domain-containing protein [Mesorhizobium shangrilense]|uniref:DUF982 domain-containing protein n=1 Tax=Mesorhizobium shangrilense TaxID=460060 RepID=A0ABV2DR15_9HYPH